MRASVVGMTNPTTKRFGAYLTKLATDAGYDLNPRRGGRAALAAEVGMSPSAIGRALKGETLPRPAQMEPLARALGAHLPDMLREAGLVTGGTSHEWPKTEVRSAPTPEQIADQLGITHPVPREALILDIQHAIRAQERIDDAGENYRVTRG